MSAGGTHVRVGSVAAGIGLFPACARVLEQLADAPARVLLTLGEAGDPDVLATVPPNVPRRSMVAEMDALPDADACGA